MIQPIENTISHLPEHIFYSDAAALVAEVCAAFVSGPSWEKGPIMSKDLGGDHLELLEDLDQDMKDFLVEIFAEACSEIGERGLAGQVFQAEAGISAIGSASILVPEQGEDIVAVETTFEIAKQVDQEEAGGIIAGWSDLGVAVGNQAANEGEIDQRGDHFGIATLDGAIREDFHKSFFELVG